MSMYAVTKVDLDEAGHIRKAEVGKLVGDGIQGQTVEDVPRIASLIHAGDTVYSTFREGGRLELGPKFEIEILADRTEGIALQEDIPWRRIKDMERLDQD
jgi:hypothetical protein